MHNHIESTRIEYYLLIVCLCDFKLMQYFRHHCCHNYTHIISPLFLVVIQINHKHSQPHFRRHLECCNHQRKLHYNIKLIDNQKDIITQFSASIIKRFKFQKHLSSFDIQSRGINMPMTTRGKTKIPQIKCWHI